MNFYEKKAEKSAGTTTGCTDPTKDFVQSTSKFCRVFGANANQMGCDNQPDKIATPNCGKPMVCDTITHATHLV